MEVNSESVVGGDVLVEIESKKRKKSHQTHRQYLYKKSVCRWLSRVPHLLGGGSLDLPWLFLPTCEPSADSSLSMGSPPSSGSTLEPQLSACTCQLYKKIIDYTFCPILFMTIYPEIPLVVFEVQKSAAGPAPYSSGCFAWSERSLLSLLCLLCSWSCCSPLVGLSH